MVLKATAQISITDLQDISVGSSPPTSPILDQLWLDTSKEPPKIMLWNGNLWEETGIDSGLLDNEINDIVGKIKDHTNDISYLEGEVNESIKTTVFEEYQDGTLEKIEELESNWERTAEKWDLSFTKSSGHNLLKNSVGYASREGEIEYWDYFGVVETKQNLGLESILSGSAFILQGFDATITQEVSTEIGEVYTLSMSYKMEESQPTIAMFFAISDVFEDETNENISYSVEEQVYEGFKEISLSFEAKSNNTQVMIKNFAGRNMVADLMLTKGEQKKEWSSHPSELYTTNFLSDEKGFKVRQVINGVEIGYTEMTPSEFAGYYRGTKVFKMNKHVFEMSNAKVEKQITLGGYRLISMANGLGIAPVNI